MKTYKEKIKDILKDDNRKKKKEYAKQQGIEEKEYKDKLLAKFGELAVLLEEIKGKDIKIPKFPTEIDVKNFPEFPKEMKVTNFPEQKEFPKEIDVKNFPEQKEFPKKIDVDVKNFPEQPKQKEFPKKIDVDVKNFPKQKELPNEFKISNLKEIQIPKIPKEMEVKEPSWWRKWVDKQDNETLLGKFLQALLGGIDKTLNKHTDPDKAFAVKLVSTDNQFYNAMLSAVSGGGYEIVGIKKADNTRIDPATEDKQDDTITAIEANTTAIGTNTDEIEALNEGNPLRRTIESNESLEEIVHELKKINFQLSSMTGMEDDIEEDELNNN